MTGVESGYNIAAGLTGKDVTQTDAEGNARQMEWLERGTRLAGGLFGAQQTVKSEISAANSAVNKLDDIFKNPPKSQMEMVTPEGFRIKVNDNTFDDASDHVLLSKAKNQESSVGRRNLDSHEGVSGVTAGKSDTRFSNMLANLRVGCKIESGVKELEKRPHFIMKLLVIAQ